MNKLEKTVYDIVKAVPWVKFLFRNIYQSFFDLLPRRQEFYINRIEYRENCFYGFHDKSPLSYDCKKILANHLKIDTLRMPNPDDELEVGYFKFEDGTFSDYISIGTSLAWNYHKGCRLQWINDEKIIFNTAINNKLVSKIVNTTSLKEIIIDFPIDTVSTDGNLATSFSYERLENLMPGYGYPYTDGGLLDKNAPSNTGLYLVDLINNQRTLAISLETLANDLHKEISEPNSYRHYVTHSEFSPDNRYVSFLHRWVSRDVLNRKSRLVIFDQEEHKHFALPTSGMVSHYVWNKKNQILAYCSVNNKDCHAIFDIPEIDKFKPIATDTLNSDGHQSFITEDSFITDTYPDKYRMAKLLRVNIVTDESQLLASIHSPKKFQTKNFNKHIACDLHPRVSPDGKYVCFDAVRNGNRSLCLMKIE
ncbi:TolB-like translocation protein [Perlabentimonas gracilis]|uniref:hypothetical protein n=1 Tax=Perlabentimonas gracilis TaxID=2715279 RepID=UPI00140CF520|nr:hypothetical protein [Perlabentimonas gracilis]NHB69851.1 hypothetical protein [Perlabentimonas gracilis]